MDVSTYDDGDNKIPINKTLVTSISFFKLSYISVLYTNNIFKTNVISLISDIPFSVISYYLLMNLPLLITVYLGCQYNL